MKRYWSGLAVAGMLAATAALGAQAQNPANTPPADRAAQPGSQREQQTPPSAESRTPSTVTISGCIQNAPMASASPGAAGQANPQSGQANQGRSASQTGTTASSQSGQRFVLNNARMSASGAAGRSAVGTTGTAATSYQLDGQTAEVSKHLNHQVEITGTVQSSPASATGSASAAQGSTAAGPTLRVTSVRMLASTCETSNTPGTSGATQPRPTDSTPDPANPAGGNPSVPAEPRPNDAPTPRP
jgi:hypothetical protein